MSVRRPLLAALVVALAATLAPVATAGAAEPYQATVDLTFPTVPAARFSLDYHQARSGGRTHKATDLLVAKHSPAYAAVAGTVCYITGIDEPMPSWGYSLSICGADGRTYKYLHLNNDRPGTDDGQGGVEHAYAPGIRRGSKVARGQLVAWIGDSGNAESTASHLHFEIHDERVTDPYGDNRMDPYNSLMDAKARRDFADGTVVAPVIPSARVAGADRVGTAIALSKSAFASAPAVVIAPSIYVAEAIVSGPLAAALEGPVLTTHPTALDPRVVAEIRRLGATRVLTVGLPTAIAESLTTAGIAVERITGTDRYDLAANVARRTWRAQEAGGTFDGRRVLVALGEHPDPSRAWPDALMASYLGAAIGRPVLLVAPDALPPATAAVLADSRRAMIIGGEAAVPATIADGIARLGPEVRRVWGETRYSTALAVSDVLVSRDVVSTGETWVATGRNWPDAATAGPVVAAKGDLLLLVDGDAAGADAETMRYLSRRAGAIEKVIGIGGAVAVTPTALSRTASYAT